MARGVRHVHGMWRVAYAERMVWSAASEKLAPVPPPSAPFRSSASPSLSPPIPSIHALTIAC